MLPSEKLDLPRGSSKRHVQVCGIYDLDLLLIVSTLGRADVGTDASMAEVRAISLLLSIHYGALSKQTGTLI